MSDHATLRDAIIYFSEFEHCKEFMVELRWPDGKVKCPVCGSAKVCNTRRKPELQAMVRENVEAGSELFSDALKSYDGLDEFQHQVIDHAESYVNGNVHTNN